MKGGPPVVNNLGSGQRLQLLCGNNDCLDISIDGGPPVLGLIYAGALNVSRKHSISRRIKFLEDVDFVVQVIRRSRRRTLLNSSTEGVVLEVDLHVAGGTGS